MSPTIPRTEKEDKYCRIYYKPVDLKYDAECNTEKGESVPYADYI
jgi:hypothetical protein